MNISKENIISTGNIGNTNCIIYRHDEMNDIWKISYTSNFDYKIKQNFNLVVKKCFNPFIIQNNHVLNFLKPIIMETCISIFQTNTGFFSIEKTENCLVKFFNQDFKCKYSFDIILDKHVGCPITKRCFYNSYLDCLEIYNPILKDYTLLRRNGDLLKNVRPLYPCYFSIDKSNIIDPWGVILGTVLTEQEIIELECLE